MLRVTKPRTEFVIGAIIVLTVVFIINSGVLRPRPHIDALVSSDVGCVRTINLSFTHKLAAE